MPLAPAGDELGRARALPNDYFDDLHDTDGVGVQAGASVAGGVASTATAVTAF